MANDLSDLGGIGIEPPPSVGTSPNIPTIDPKLAIPGFVLQFLIWSWTHPKESAQLSAALLAAGVVVTFAADLLPAAPFALPLLLRYVFDKLDKTPEKMGELNTELEFLQAGIHSLDWNLGDLGRVSDSVAAKLAHWNCDCPGSTGGYKKPPTPSHQRRPRAQRHQGRKKQTNVRVLNYTSELAVVESRSDTDTSTDITIAVGRRASARPRTKQRPSDRNAVMNQGEGKHPNG
jgi:hypothetical protein